MHLLKTSIFSLNNDLVRLTKIMNNLVKHLKILSFKVIFQCLKLVESFQNNKKKICEEYLIWRPTYIIENFWTLIFKVLYLLKICPIFVGYAHNFGKSDYLAKKYLFPIDALVVWCPTWSRNLGRTLLEKASLAKRLAQCFWSFEGCW